MSLLFPLAKTVSELFLSFSIKKILTVPKYTPTMHWPSHTALPFSFNSAPPQHVIMLQLNSVNLHILFHLPRPSSPRYWLWEVLILLPQLSSSFTILWDLNWSAYLTPPCGVGRFFLFLIFISLIQFITLLLEAFLDFSASPLHFAFFCSFFKYTANFELSMILSIQEYFCYQVT